MTSDLRQCRQLAGRVLRMPSTMGGSGMRVFKHQTGHSVAVTPDKEGRALPAGDWVLISETDIEPGESRIGRSADEILADINERGYSIIPDDR